MKMTFNEIKETCDDFVKFMESKGIEPYAFTATGFMEDEITLTLEEAREHGIIKSKDCCEGGPQWGHAWDCPKQVG